MEQDLKPSHATVPLRGTKNKHKIHINLVSKTWFVRRQNIELQDFQVSSISYNGCGSNFLLNK